ncbi:MAG: hypothetical protein Q8R28_04555 [Dehalococcoidia bacterium]|nr:hypothetical protein [Dehalococcoidia bacterium]
MGKAYHVTIRLGNAAFGDDADREVSRILRELADDVLERGVSEIKLFDVNGNEVGHAERKG